MYDILNITIAAKIICSVKMWRRNGILNREYCQTVFVVFVVIRAALFVFVVVAGLDAVKTSPLANLRSIGQKVPLLRRSCLTPRVLKPVKDAVTPLNLCISN